jgi:hypothetical protein
MPVPSNSSRAKVPLPLGAPLPAIWALFIGLLSGEADTMAPWRPSGSEIRHGRPGPRRTSTDGCGEPGRRAEWLRRPHGLLSSTSTIEAQGDEELGGRCGMRGRGAMPGLRM